MNKIIITGNLTADPTFKENVGEKKQKITNYSIAVNRRKNENGESVADFFRCTAFDQRAEFANEFFKKGMRVNIIGHVQTGSYVDRSGVRIPTFSIIVEDQEFGERRQSRTENQEESLNAPVQANDEFMDIPDDVDDDLPYGLGRSI